MSPLGGMFDEMVIRHTYESNVDETNPRQQAPKPGWLTRKPAGMGELTLLEQVKETAETVKSIKPILEFVGNYPMLTLSLLMAAIVAGGAAGGYIGAGYRAKAVRKNPEEDEGAAGAVRRLRNPRWRRRRNAEIEEETGFVEDERELEEGHEEAEDQESPSDDE